MASTHEKALTCCAGRDGVMFARAQPAINHSVDLYADEQALAEHAAQFLVLGFLAAEAAILIVTPGHREAIEAALRSRDVDVAAVERSGTLRIIDAEDYVKSLLSAAAADAFALPEAIGKLVQQMNRGHTRVRVFSEAAALLWARGDRKHAFVLESAWNAVCEAEDCAVRCAHPAQILAVDTGEGRLLLGAHLEATVPGATLCQPELGSWAPASGRGALRELIARWCAADVPFTLVLLDLDDFHIINHEFGPEFGDEVLAAVRNVLGGAVRKDDRVVPCVGDRFGIMLANVSGHAGALSIVRKLKEALADPLRVRGQEVYVTVSSGVAVRPPGTGQQDVLTAATTALHEAKGNRAHKSLGRGSPQGAPSTRGRHMPTLLRKALERGELELYYQPRVNASSRAVTGAEALLRWRSSELGWVPPAHFVAAAERSGLILPIGEWVLETACRQAAQWRAQGADGFRIAVNLSASQLCTPGLTATIRRVLETTALAPEALELELTETAIMDRVSSNIDKLRALRELGLSVAVDDFGTGYSSLSYLTRLPVQVLKIDRSFVADMTREREARTLVGAIAGLAQSLGLTTVAEGVETQEQLGVARALRCDEIQGFLFGRPVPPSDFEQLHLSQVRTAA